MAEAENRPSYQKVDSKVEIMDTPASGQLGGTFSGNPAAVCILASEDGLEKLREAGAQRLDTLVKVAGIGRGTDAMRMADRPHGPVPLFPWEKPYRKLTYPGVHSFRAGRAAALEAYRNAGITEPMKDLDFVELHDAYTSSEIQTYEDMGLCRYGEGGPLAASGATFMPGVDYGLKLKGKVGRCPVNPSGGLIACGHPVGATGLMQGVFALWQLQGRIKQHFGNPRLQVKHARRGAIHSHAGTGTYVTVSILERA